MYSHLPSFVFGFHGCDRSVLEQVLYKHVPLEPSSNAYDWLGSGIYFWEQDPQRALEYATQLRERPGRAKRRVIEPAVIGAVIDLGNCLNLMQRASIQAVEAAYQVYCTSEPDPSKRAQNKSGKGGGDDLLLRNLDCAVINTLHAQMQEYNLPAYDTVRGLFAEDKPLYENAGFRRNTHIQICVRNPRCIKGYFLPMLDGEASL